MRLLCSAVVFPGRFLTNVQLNSVNFSIGPAWPLQHQIQGLGSARCALVLASSQCSRYVVIPQIVEMVLVKEGGPVSW